MEALANKSDPAPLAYSYIRFSSKRQGDGDSVRRQTDGAAVWCQRHDAHLDTSTTLHDLGKSAFTGSHRLNPDRNALAAFLKLVEQGRIPRGSFLIVESLDRLTREDILPALSLVLNLIQSGIRIVQLIPVEMIYDEKVEPMQLMLAITELSRGNSESRVKSERCGAAWSRKKKAARESNTVMSNNLPRWIECHDEKLRDKLRLIPERAAIVRQIFELAASGYGLVSIVKKLTADGIPSFGGRRADWTRSYLGLILQDRRALGEHQPMKNGKPDGDVIHGYYPNAVNEDQWHAARAGLTQRRKHKGRIGSKNVNIFAGLLRSALDGSAYYLTAYKAADKKVQALANIRATEGLSGFRTFRYDIFENAVLSQLKELKPQEIGQDHKPDRIEILSSERIQIEADIAAMEVELEHGGDIPSVARVLRKKELLLGEVLSNLTTEKQRAASPLAESLGDVKTLVEVLANSPDPTDTRLRLRAALRRMVTDARLLVVGNGPIRLAAVQFCFAAGSTRSYLIIWQPACAPRGKLIHLASTKVVSFASAALAEELDLRNPEHAQRLEQQLANLPAEVLKGLLAAKQPEGAEPAEGKPKKKRKGRCIRGTGTK